MTIITITTTIASITGQGRQPSSPAPLTIANITTIRIIIIIITIIMPPRRATDELTLGTHMSTLAKGLCAPSLCGPSPVCA